MNLEDLRGSHVVVLGAAGFLGSHLCSRLLELGAHVTAIDNFITGTATNLDHLVGHGELRLLSYDVTDFLHAPGQVDAVLHFASPASPIDYLRWPIQTLKVGSLGTHKALGLPRAKDARLLLASTSEVYGDPQVSPQSGDHWGNVSPIRPRGVYDEAKRFAEAMALAYHREHGVKVHIARIFNSILAAEQVLYDDGTTLRREAIGELASRIGDRADLSGYAVPAFDADGTVAAAKAIAFEGHPTAARCYEVSTWYGRSVRVTGDHSLFAEGPDGRPVARTVDALEVGDHIAIAGRADVPVRDRPHVDMVEVWRASGRNPWDLMVRAPQLGHTVFPRRLELTPALAARGRPRQQCWNLVERWRQHDEAPLGALQRLGIPVPDSAHVRLADGRPRALLPRRIALTDELLWTLGLYTAEGTYHRKPGRSAYITIAGNDPSVLGRARKALERDPNVHVAGAEGSSARSAALFVHAELLLMLLDHLGFPGTDKGIPGWVLGLPLERLAWFIEGYREGDGVHSGDKIAAGRHEVSTTSSRLKDDLVVALARFGIVSSIGRHETTFRQRTGGRRYPFWRVTVCNPRPLELSGGVTQCLNARRHGDLVWARVTAIDEVPATEVVYDFCVPGRENFWAGTGVMAHNTYGPRMRVDDGRAVPAFFSAALRNEPLPVHGDGTQTRSLCYVDDEIDGLLRLLVSDEVGPVNIGNPEEHTILELAETIQHVVGTHPCVEFHPRPTDDPTVRRPDITLARRVLDWEPKVPLIDGLERTLPWFVERLAATRA